MRKHSKGLFSFGIDTFDCFLHFLMCLHTKYSNKLHFHQASQLYRLQLSTQQKLYLHLSTFLIYAYIDKPELNSRGRGEVKHSDLLYILCLRVSVPPGAYVYYSDTCYKAWNRRYRASINSHFSFWTTMTGQ